MKAEAAKANGGAKGKAMPMAVNAMAVNAMAATAEAVKAKALKAKRW